MNKRIGTVGENEGQTGERLRQELWEAVRAMKLRNETLIEDGGMFG